MRLGATLAAVAILIAGSMGMTEPARAGEPADNGGFDGYPQPSEWDELMEYLEQIGADGDETAAPPPAAPIEAPVEVPVLPVVVPADAAVNAGAEPAAVQLPSTGSGTHSASMPVAALFVAMLGVLTLASGRALRLAGRRV